MTYWKNWEENFIKKIWKQKGFRRTPSKMIPYNLLQQLCLQEEEYRKRKERESFERDSQREKVVYSVSFRRKWLHALRKNAGQDSALNDYKISDKDLTLDWVYLQKES